MTDRIYDNPNHPSYGPVRRMWKMLVGLYGFGHSDIDLFFRHEWGVNWDEHVHCMIQDQGYTEQQALRVALWKVLDTDFH